uniref:Uncharacterized protein n=1 Tax=Schizaphis graminum TaxID=13262 RepID=A0A2S2PEL0_SCHGA
MPFHIRKTSRHGKWQLAMNTRYKTPGETTSIYIRCLSSVVARPTPGRLARLKKASGIFRPTSKALASLYPRRQVWQGYLVVRLRRISHRRRFTVRRLRPLVHPPHSATIRTVYTRQSSLYTLLYTPPPPPTTTNTRRWRRRHVET